MSETPLVLEWVPGAFAVVRFPADAPVPDWAAAPAGNFLSITRTDRELSVVSPQEVVPGDVEAERGWVAVRVGGNLHFSEVGILALLSGALAVAGVPIFAVSTHDTDVLLFKAKDLQKATEALASVADVSGL